MYAVLNGPNIFFLYKIGELFGIGFQLRDDLLDVYGSENFGKKIGGDILENKKTFLSIFIWWWDHPILRVKKKWFQFKK